MEGILTADTILKVKNMSDQIYNNYLNKSNFDFTLHYRQRTDNKDIDVLVCSTKKEPMNTIALLYNNPYLDFFMKSDYTNENKDFIKKLERKYEFSYKKEGFLIIDNYHININTFESYKLTGSIRQLWNKNKTFYYIQGQKQTGEIYDSVNNKRSIP